MSEPTPPLSPDLAAALANLRRKEAGEDVGWISITAARGLVDAGLALRTANGWRITPAGQAAVFPDADASTAVTPMTRG